MSTDSTVQYAISDGVATLTLNRPELYNALNAQLHADLMAALRQAERDATVRAVIVTGAGKAFCSGQDLREIPADGVQALIGERLRASYNPLVAKLRGMPKPIIAAVNGVAAGAGMGLALACDLCLAGESARFVNAFVRIGLIPDCGTTYFLPRLIGRARAFELSALGGELDAPTALQWGLINRVLPDAELLAAAQVLGAQLAAGPALAISLIKRSLDRAEHATLPEMLEYEAQAQQATGAHPDFTEGLAAFREKRPARFE
jgi:2-(1,2-epoxy-1,2-dihydrophenyl)acetyl-CoA isomerase